MKKNVLALAAVFSVLTSCLFGQPLNKQPLTSAQEVRLDSLLGRYCFVSKDMLKHFNVQKIKYIHQDDCDRKDQLICFELYVFEKGKLKREISLDDQKLDLNDALDLGYTYTYTKEKQSDKLKLRYGDAYNGKSQQDHLNKYFYTGNKLKSEDYREGILTGGRRDTITTVHAIISYFYKQNGRLNNFKVVSSEKPNDYQIFYYLYSNSGSLIGLYPSKGQDTESVADSIYDISSIKELKKIGFEKFSDKHFLPEMLKKVVEDSYTPVKSEYLLIDGLPSNQFFRRKLGKTFKYIVFEIADNYFLFYKLID